jgi:hypothetical protein
MTDNNEKIKFVIIAEPRTGSNNFIDKINCSHDVDCHRELFHPHAVYMREEARNDLINLRDENPLGFLNEHINLSTKRAFGFKIFNNHNNLLLKNILNDVFFKKIILYRNNYLSVYSSERIAEITNEYLKKLSSDNNLVDSKFDLNEVSIQLDFDENDFLYHWQKYDEFYAEVISALNKTNQSYLFFSYEDSVNNLLFRRVFSWLGLAQPEYITSSLVKQNTSNVLKRFRDPEKVLNFINRFEKPFWAYDNFLLFNPHCNFDC